MLYQSASTYQRKNFVTKNVLLACRSTRNALQNLKTGEALPLTPSGTAAQLQQTLQTAASKN